MPDGFGLLNPVTAPYLDKVLREEHSAREHPRKRRDEKAGPSTDDEFHHDDSAEEIAAAEESVSSNHIDLRI